MSSSEPDGRSEFYADILDSARRRFHGMEMTGKCVRCTHSHIYKTSRENTPHVLCAVETPTKVMPVDISECNRFSQIGRLNIWDLAKLAIDVDLGKTSLGFKQEE